jgi:Dolichyl-phosphate-mannose-protein mannosyltransferase
LTQIARLLTEETPSLLTSDPAPGVVGEGQPREPKRSLDLFARTSPLVLVSLCVGIGLRLLYLDADPYYYEWIGYITDEGRWVQHARSLALYGILPGGHAHGLHLFLAPLFQLVHYLIFSLAGVNFWSARILTAVSGSAIPVLFCWKLRRSVTPQALLLGTTLLAVQPDLVELSRVAIPETVVMLFQLVVYFLIVEPGASSRRLFAAGLILVIGVGMKATIVPMLAIFSLLIGFAPLATSTTRAERWPHVLAFWCGFAAPAAVMAPVGFIGSLTPSSVVLPRVSIFGDFLRLNDAFSTGLFLFADSFSPTVNFWGLGVWLSVLAWTANQNGEVLRPLRPYLASSMIWLGCYFVLMLLLSYFPTRYKVHILLPMAVQTAAGLSLLQRGGIERVCASFGEGSALTQRLRSWLLSLPTAALLAPILASLASLAGTDPSRLRSKMVCLAVASIPAAFVAHRLRRNPLSIKFLMVFPLVAGLVWFLGSASGLNGSFYWPSATTAVADWPWWISLLGSIVIAGVWARSVSVWRFDECARFVTLYALLYLAGSLFSLAPGYIDRHYSIRDASRDLGEFLANSSSVAVARAEGLFLGNTVSYESFESKMEADPPETVVVGFVFRGRKGWLDQNYHVAKTYQLYVSPEYARLQPDALDSAAVATVYQRNR